MSQPPSSHDPNSIAIPPQQQLPNVPASSTSGSARPSKFPHEADYLVNIIGAAIFGVLILFSIESLTYLFLLLAFGGQIGPGPETIDLSYALKIAWLILKLIAALTILVSSAINLSKLAWQTSKRSTETILLVVIMICFLIFVGEKTWETIANFLPQQAMPTEAKVRWYFILSYLSYAAMYLMIFVAVALFTLWPKRFRARA